MIRGLTPARTPWRVVAAVPAALLLSAMSWTYLGAVDDYYDETIDAVRNFYGVLRVRVDVDEGQVKLYHGSIRHGAQFLDSERRLQRASYYSPASGIGRAIDYHPRSQAARRDGGEARRLHIGVVGLGGGALAASGQQGDRVRFYEIDPDVEVLAREHFSYLEESAAEVTVVIGDARVSMEREYARGEIQGFDILVLDAFSGDAIPVHVLTLEAVELYWKHMASDGILAIHISNRNLELSPVVRAIATALDKQVIYTKNYRDATLGISRATWVLMTSNEAFFDADEVRMVERDWPEVRVPELLWTDDYSNLFLVLE